MSQKVRESKRRCSRQDRSTAVLCCTTVVLSVEARDQNRRKREREKEKRRKVGPALNCTAKERREKGASRNPRERILCAQEQKRERD